MTDNQVLEVKFSDISFSNMSAHAGKNEVRAPGF